MKLIPPLTVLASLTPWVFATSMITTVHAEALSSSPVQAPNIHSSQNYQGPGTCDPLDSGPNMCYPLQGDFSAVLSIQLPVPKSSQADAPLMIDDLSLNLSTSLAQDSPNMAIVMTLHPHPQLKGSSMAAPQLRLLAGTQEIAQRKLPRDWSEQDAIPLALVGVKSQSNWMDLKVVYRLEGETVDRVLLNNLVPNILVGQ
jgi:hypothetical protein